MRKRERQNQYSAPSQAPQQNHSALDEAQALFEQMKSGVIAHSETKREEARSRGKLARMLLMLTIVACLLATATMIFGIYHFADAPIRQTERGYVGKGGKPRTQADYEAFIFWGKAIVIVIPSVFVLGFAFVIVDSRRRRKPLPSDSEDGGNK